MQPQVTRQLVLFEFEDLNGNRIVHNTIGTNNTGGDPLDGTAKDPSTTGILVFSGTVPVSVTIAHNRIRDNQYGVWLGVAGHPGRASAQERIPVRLGQRLLDGVDCGGRQVRLNELGSREAGQLALQVADREVADE